MNPRITDFGWIDERRALGFAQRQLRAPRKIRHVSIDLRSLGPEERKHILTRILDLVERPDLEVELLFRRLGRRITGARAAEEFVASVEDDDLWIHGDVALHLSIGSEEAELVVFPLEDGYDLEVSAWGNGADDVIVRIVDSFATGRVGPAERRVRFAGLEVDTRTHRVRCGNTWLDLPYIQFELLLALVSDPGRVWSFDELLVLAWGPDATGHRRLLKAAVRRLRRFLETADAGVKIRAVSGGFSVEAASPQT